MEERFNYLGATIFWLYNVAALFFSAVVIYTILTLPQFGKSDQGKREKGVTLFSALACISFATLSYNMLNVLIQSFDSWLQEHDPGVNNGVIYAIWKWSITSTLFQDFAEAIVADSARYLWVQTALFATLSVCFHMAAEGTRRQVPRLWAFFCLSQILPISFTQNLFYVALVRSPDRGARVTASSSVLLSLTAVYSACVILAPLAAGSSWLMNLILITRLLLVAPSVLFTTMEPTEPGRSAARPSQRSGRRTRVLIAAFAVLSTLWQVYILSLDQHTLGDISRALFSHPAVSSLGCDLLISLLSYVLWASRQSYAPSTRAGSK